MVHSALLFAVLCFDVLTVLVLVVLCVLARFTFSEMPFEFHASQTCVSPFGSYSRENVPVTPERAR